LKDKLYNSFIIYMYINIILIGFGLLILGAVSYLAYDNYNSSTYTSSSGS
jgi:hypothetical protein